MMVMSVIAQMVKRRIAESRVQGSTPGEGDGTIKEIICSSGLCKLNGGYLFSGIVWVGLGGGRG